MGMVCVAMILGEPVPKKRPRCGRGGARSAQGQADAERAIAWEVKAQNVGMEPATGPVFVDLLFYSRYGPGHYPQRQADVDNLAKLVMDALNKISWDDDRQVVDMRARLIRGAVQPRTFLLVKEIDE